MVAAPAAEVARVAVRVRQAARAAAPALIAYGVLRVLGVATLAVAAAREDRSVWKLLGRFDATWYVQIAESGYDPAIPTRADGGLASTDLAFFPLYPALIAVLDPVLPGVAPVAALVISWLAGVVAAAGLYALGLHLRDRRTGIALAALWAVLPHAIVQSMGYTETLFTALAAWSLWALLRGHWLVAGGLCGLAGLTRPTAGALVAAVVLAAAVAILRRRDGWRPWAAGLLAPLGLLGYLLWVGHRLGRLDGYLHVQSDAWGMSFDGGRFTLDVLGRVLTTPQDLVIYVTTLVVILAVLLFALVVALAVVGRVPWPLLVFAGLVLILALGGEGYFHAKGRLLLPAFPLLLPIAFGLARARTLVWLVVFVALAAFSSWYATYLCLVWPRSP